MRHRSSSSYLFGLLCLAPIGTALGGDQENVIELEASWVNGEGLVQVQSRYRLEQVGTEISALGNTKSQVFRGKVGPCAKRIVFKYPGTNVPNASYYFGKSRMIELAPGKEHTGRMFTYKSSELPAVSQLLGEVKPGKVCRGDA